MDTFITDLRTAGTAHVNFPFAVVTATVESGSQWAWLLHARARAVFFKLKSLNE